MSWKTAYGNHVVENAVKSGSHTKKQEGFEKLLSHNQIALL